MLACAAFGLFPLGLSGCAGDAEVQGGSAFGSLGLEVKLAEGVKLGELTYVISGADALGTPFEKSGAANVKQSGVIKLQVGGIPPGAGYDLTLSGTGPGVICAGGATFDVESQRREKVTVQLKCHLDKGGSILVSGETNVCPLVSELTVLPAQVEVGGSAVLSAEVTDVDGLPAALSYAWSTTGGSLTSWAEEPTGAGASLLCTEAGDVTVTLQATDGDCGDVVLAVITCAEGSPDAGVGLVWNEVESNGGVPDDWAELYNGSSQAIDLSGYTFKDDDDAHVYVVPAGTVVPAQGYLVVEGYGFGLGSGDSVRLFDVEMNLVLSYTWEGHAPTTHGRCPDASGEFAITTTSTKGGPNDCSPQIWFNEVESSGGTPDDWVELVNAGLSTADLSGYLFRDNDDTHQYVLPSGTTVAPGGYLVLGAEEFGFGLGSDDAARLFDPEGSLVAETTWSGHAATTYGRCPDGVGDFATTLAATKGEPNDCPLDPNTAAPWPGATGASTVDEASSFPSNLSGLHYEPAQGGSPAVLWGALNGPSKIYRLVESGGLWVPEVGASSDGKLLAYPDGAGQPDAEGITRAEWDSSAVYVSTERNNEASGTSRLSVLRYDWTLQTSPLAASHEWNLTAVLPTVGANLGLEAITWIPDSVLVSGGLWDELRGKAYDPSDYSGHGTGLFVVGVEGTGSLHVLALDHVGGEAFVLSTVPSGHVAAMGLEFDRESGLLWAICDDTCQGESTVLSIDRTPGSPTEGQFTVVARFARPEGLPNSNNEGFAFAAQNECTADLKRAFWADDSNFQNHALREGALSCGPIL